MAKTMKTEEVLFNFQMAVSGLQEAQRFDVNAGAEQVAGKGEAINRAFGAFQALRNLAWVLGIQHVIKWNEG